MVLRAVGYFYSLTHSLSRKSQFLVLFLVFFGELKKKLSVINIRIPYVIFLLVLIDRRVKLQEFMKVRIKIYVFIHGKVQIFLDNAKIIICLIVGIKMCSG